MPWHRMAPYGTVWHHESKDAKDNPSVFPSFYWGPWFCKIGTESGYRSLPTMDVNSSVWFDIRRLVSYLSSYLVSFRFGLMSFTVCHQEEACLRGLWKMFHGSLGGSCQKMSTYTNTMYTQCTTPNVQNSLLAMLTTMRCLKSFEELDTLMSLCRATPITLLCPALTSVASFRMMRQSGSFTHHRPFRWMRASVLQTMFLPWKRLQTRIKREWERVRTE